MTFSRRRAAATLLASASWRLAAALASASAVPATMRAWVAPSADPASFHYDANFTTPSLGSCSAARGAPGRRARVLVRVACSSVNPRPARPTRCSSPSRSADAAGVVVAAARRAPPPATRLRRHRRERAARRGPVARDEGPARTPVRRARHAARACPRGSAARRVRAAQGRAHWLQGARAWYAGAPWTATRTTRRAARRARRARARARARRLGRHGIAGIALARARRGAAATTARPTSTTARGSAPTA